MSSSVLLISCGVRSGSPQHSGSCRPLSGLPPPGFGLSSSTDHVLQFGPPMIAVILPSLAAVMIELYGSCCSMLCDLFLSMSSSTTYGVSHGAVSCIAVARLVLSSLPA